jgi:dethiobiotin synthetase
MSKGLFITGTDTGIGKTRVTLSLMEELKKQGHRVAGMKPIASGAILKNEKLVNEDAELILRSCSKQTDYELINPTVFELPVSPHIAASKANEIIDLDLINASYSQLASKNDIVIVEGVGGWRVPLSADTTLADLVRKLDLPVMLVVGLRLGCINHAILTAEAIKADGLSLHGWVSNQVEKDYLFAEDTINTLKISLSCPYMASFSFNDAFEPADRFVWSNLLLDSNSL